MTSLYVGASCWFPLCVTHVFLFVGTRKQMHKEKHVEPIEANVFQRNPTKKGPLKRPPNATAV